MRFGPPEPLRSHLMMMGAGPSNGGDDTVTAEPSNTVAPVASFDTPPGRVGTMASTTNGTWTQSPTSYSYQWQRGGSDIVAATAATYELTVDDAAQSITCLVTAANGIGSSSPVSSNTITPAALSVPENLAAPVIAQGPAGQFSISTAATWQNANPTSYTENYQWQESADNSSWSDLTGENNASFTSGVTSTYYRLAVTTTNAHGTSLPAYSDSLQSA